MKDLLLLTLCPPLTIILTNCPPPRTSGFTFMSRQRLRYTGTISLLVDNELRAGPTGSLCLSPGRMFEGRCHVYSTGSSRGQNPPSRMFYTKVFIHIWIQLFVNHRVYNLVSVQKTSYVGLKYQFFPTNMATF